MKKVPDTLFPDGLDKTSKTIQEVKNTNYQSLTGQLKAFIEFAKQDNFKFDLTTRTSTHISRPLQNALDSSGSTLKKVLPDKAK